MSENEPDDKKLAKDCGSGCLRGKKNKDEP
jgi:hypothetical protein